MACKQEIKKEKPHPFFNISLQFNLSLSGVRETAVVQRHPSSQRHQVTGWGSQIIALQRRRKQFGIGQAKIVSQVIIMNFELNHRL